jgi:hypothetical protein
MSSLMFSFSAVLAPKVVSTDLNQKPECYSKAVLR